MLKFSFSKFQQNACVEFIERTVREYFGMFFSDDKIITGKENIYVYNIVLQIDLSDVEIMDDEKIVALIKGRAICELDYIIGNSFIES